MKKNAHNWKPFQIVVVDREICGQKISHYGEVLSYPFISDDNPGVDSLMVRTVPGFAGSLIEVPVANVRRAQGTPRYVHYAAVGGSGSFPVDMLRYDFCAPVNFDLVEKPSGMVKAVVRFQLGEQAGDLVVARASNRSWPSWTPARWQSLSFLWGLRELKTEELKP